MHRLETLADLKAYADYWLNLGAEAYPGFTRQEEAEAHQRITGFIKGTPDCFERTTTAGHVTGSALVTSPDFTQVLLTLHAKLGLWLQLGGHADGHSRIYEVAWREVEEESGLRPEQFAHYEILASKKSAATGRSHPLPFDLDYHQIPARPHEPAHIHYDLRYLIIADPKVPLIISPESKDLRWFSLAQARQTTQERSMLRQFDKLAWISAQLTGA